VTRRDALRVCLYAAGAQNWTHFDRGIPRYIVEHVRSIHRLAPSTIDSVLLNPGLALTGNLNWLIGTGLLAWNSDDRRAARWPGASSAQVYHVMSPFEWDTPVDVMWPHWARRASVATVVTVYDLIPLVFSEHYLRDPRVRVAYETRLGLLRRADQVLAISDATAHDVVEHLGLQEDRVHVIHAGATEAFRTMYTSKNAAWAKLGERLRSIRDGFLLYVGGFEFRKNLEGMIAGYAHLAPKLREKHQLVIACRMSPDDMRALERRAADVAVDANQMILTGYVNDAELGALYHTCKLFVFPSLYEGSGLPILEAMSCGAPVVGSATSTGPELHRDRAAMFDPYDPAAIAACLTRVLASQQTLDRLSAHGQRRAAEYTWQRVAEESIAGYERAVVRTSRRLPRRPRIALVTPWLPEQSGIAVYNLRLARELGRKVDVDVVVSASLGEYTSPKEYGVRLIPVRDFGQLSRVRQHDRLVYCMGNSQFHRHTYQLLKTRPGALVLHDVRLTGFYGWFAGIEQPESPNRALAEHIHALYGDRIPPHTYADDAPNWDRQLALGIFMTRELQACAEECFVHSRFARDVLELDRDSGDRETPISVLPFGIPPADGPPRGAATANPLIVSLGWLAEVKGLELLISAFGLLLEQLPGARLIVAGPTSEQESRRWHILADHTGAGARVEIPGYVDDDQYAELLRTADLAVQLRLVSNGEASAAVADCIAAGLPTIVTDLGWAAELPDGAVEKLPTGAQPGLLQQRMLALLTNEPRRRSMSEAALAHASESSFSRVADAYLEALGLV
jgi:glycosyltransferase involved in cell wall biosynthesis